MIHDSSGIGFGQWSLGLSAVLFDRFSKHPCRTMDPEVRVIEGLGSGEWVFLMICLVRPRE